MLAIRIRKATVLDAETIGALHVASWKETYAGILPDAMLANLSVDERTAMWRDVLGAPQNLGATAVIVADDAGAVVGFGACGRQRDEALANGGYGGEFGAIYVLRLHQEQGIGRSLLRAMSRELSAAGHFAASLWVLRENERARMFYERLGGIAVGEKTEKTPHGALVEKAYGWRDFGALTR